MHGDFLSWQVSSRIGESAKMNENEKHGKSMRLKTKEEIEKSPRSEFKNDLLGKSINLEHIRCERGASNSEDSDRFKDLV
jgi:hypothetical protein